MVGEAASDVSGGRAQSRRILVTSIPPDWCDPESVDPLLLALFRAMMPELVRSTAIPYAHQAACFAKVLAGEEVALIAGTAAGKTLAIAVPLFHQVFQSKQLRKVVFVYPTRALLADQRRVLQGLVVACGKSEQDIGEVRGGMTSAALIHAMSRAVVVATPDALYWFFRKNVKFSMTLIYGLAQADAIVLDEAHLYTGLMQRNMWHFLQRLRHYRGTYLGMPLRIHYLTATANNDLRDFSPSSEELTGRSKCTDVTVHLRAMARKDLSNQLEHAIVEALEAGGKRILVVANSARLAHGLFLGQRYELRGADDRAAVPSWFWEHFGLVPIGLALGMLRRIAPGLEKEAARRVREEVRIRVRDLDGARVRLRAEYLGELAASAIERDAQKLRRLLQRYARLHGDMINPGRLGVMLRDSGVTDAARRLEMVPANYEAITAALEGLATRSDDLTLAVQQRIDAQDHVDVHGKHGGILFAGNAQTTLEGLLPVSGLTGDMRKHIVGSMLRGLVIDRDTVEEWEHLDDRAFKHRSLPISRFLRFIADQELRGQLATALIAQIAGHSAVGIAPSLPGEPLLMLYTGSMARYTREGVIEGFGVATTDRPIVLISTSAVEVGVDFAADTLITEECAGSSFIQRLGRVGRRTGIQARAWVLVEPSTLAKIDSMLGDASEVPRREFAGTTYECFPARKYVSASLYADALQVLVSRQLGRSGRKLAALISTPAAQALADSIRSAGIEADYGLRGTMPAVSLLDEGVSKDPFYIFSYVAEADISPAASPFEVAAINRPFNALVFSSGWRRIFVQLQESLEQCAAIAVPGPDGPAIISNLPEGAKPVRMYIEACNFLEQLGAIQEDWAEEALAVEFPLLPSGACSAPHLLLAYGPLLLGYRENSDRDSTGPVRDDRGSQIVLPPQWYLIVRTVKTVDQGWQYLERTRTSGFENEVHYDTDRPIGLHDQGLVLVDKQAGAVWEIWEAMRALEVRP